MARRKARRLLGIIRPGLGVVCLQPVEDRRAQLQRRVGNQRPQRRSGEEDSGQFRVGAGPGGTLVGEEKRLVVVHGHDQVFVVVGQTQAWELADAVPPAGPDEDRSVGVGPANEPGSSPRRSGSRLRSWPRPWARSRARMPVHRATGRSGRQAASRSLRIVAVCALGLVVNSSKWWILTITPSFSRSPASTSSSTRAKISGLIRKSGPGTGVVMPGDRNPDVVESFVLDEAKVLGVVVSAPILARGCFETVGEVRSAKETLGGHDVPADERPSIRRISRRPAGRTARARRRMVTGRPLATCRSVKSVWLCQVRA